jgi:hypothetical protein
MLVSQGELLSVKKTLESNSQGIWPVHIGASNSEWDDKVMTSESGRGWE